MLETIDRLSAKTRESSIQVYDMNKERTLSLLNIRKPAITERHRKQPRRKKVFPRPLSPASPPLLPAHPAHEHPPSDPIRPSFQFSACCTSDPNDR